MKTTHTNLVNIALIAILMITVSCKKTDENTSLEIESNEASLEKNVTSENVIKNYFQLKDALVNDNKDKATIYSDYLSHSLSKFKDSIVIDNEKDNLKIIFDNAIKNTKLISKNDIEIQRVYFKELSKNISDMIAITGTQELLYVQHCPMYDGGTNWLSNSKEIHNPYYGSKMLKCGVIKGEIK